MRRDTRQRNRAFAGLQAISGQDEMLGTLVHVIRSGKEAQGLVMLEMGRMVSESIMLMEREKVAGRTMIRSTRGSRSGRTRRARSSSVIRRCLVTTPAAAPRAVRPCPATSYARLRAPVQFSETLLEKILCGVSDQKYADTMISSAQAIGVSLTEISRKLVDLIAQKLKEFHERSLEAFKPFAIFLDTIHRGGESFLVAWVWIWTARRWPRCSGGLLGES